MRFARSLPPSQCRESGRIERRPSPRRWTPATPLRSALERHPGAADGEACSLGPGAVLHPGQPAPDSSGNPLDRPVVRGVPGGAGREEPLADAWGKRRFPRMRFMSPLLYRRLAEYYERRGKRKKAARLYEKAEAHFRRSGRPGPPFAAAMAMRRPRSPFFTWAVRKGEPRGPNDAA